MTRESNFLAARHDGRGMFVVVAWLEGVQSSASQRHSTKLIQDILKIEYFLGDGIARVGMAEMHSSQVRQKINITSLPPSCSQPTPNGGFDGMFRHVNQLLTHCCCQFVMA